MKKFINVLSIAALALTATTVLANGNMGVSAQVRANVKADGNFGQFMKGLRMGLHNDDRFGFMGTVTAVGTASLTVDVEGRHSANITTGPATVVVDADTKIRANGRSELSLADIRTGDRVAVRGEVWDNNALEADNVMIVVKPQAAYGSVTAKTDNSVTIRNSVTGTERTVTVNPDTKVVLNGEAVTAADVQVGDRGVVKFKAMLDTFVATMIRLFR
ncbi:MAG: hypothetical protein A3H72_01380 [Candidatus Doudnabacteria bacterium RIFCSPLOWO2_02_FULL_48_8]|uniref:DUF5666 domain-containing protein n=1 Tax=Candidatus Doudnabacteria bacterium RIFCSPHIGHO2_01_FULL_46_24 TaxID=1817825 RepID=A0A1F5NUD7_9BACT|nr:MAG: hypothetical protein A2720_01705 [Candidatus Doudnabacteria bacterium RIFCSPHIGHO2_01_FULL_46_24]OGE95180.1 MAG: hypothetical protein A3H72_01380 [Candidatus Doudnabacteria bacterium RIFCSPLOWO2_02_FULL_48_8]OGE95700.1 MAG: hypothetical protein A3E98_02165 [Candidatus Doudnabacteria bacterium RIFCSPHIGHO2_12_FULL_48_11]